MHYLSKALLIVYILILSHGCLQHPSGHGANPISSSGFLIKGISMVAPVQPINLEVMERLGKVNANSIALMPYAFCNPDNPVIQYNSSGHWWGESLEGVIGCIQLAHQQNLKVMMKPHLWIAHGMYTGEFTLASEDQWKEWENSYSQYIFQLAAIADSMKVELFCIGTELGASVLQRPQFWKRMIDSLKTRYHGKLTYAANWDDYRKVPFWDKLDYIGIDGYFPLNENATPSESELIENWKKYVTSLKDFSSAKSRPVLFTEYGYRNVDYNCKEPWKENDGAQNDEAQVNAFEAFYQSFAGQPWFSGGFVWKWYPDSGHHGRNKIDFTPQEKPALKVITNWYRN